ncbi:unnamed protein product [Urochloa decumbens]|uniref:Uncharacterized protein n=1 Tax=Urochloa decumbens TaxID=240449 RepID=A0ABC8YFF5_9POAL
MSSASGRHKPSRSASASTVIANNAAGYHDLKIDCYSSIKDGIPVGMPIKSSPFSVGGYRWRISFFPNGDNSARAALGCISLFLFLDEDVADPVPVTAQFEFAFMGQERASLFGNRKRAEKKLWSSSAAVTSFGSRIGSRSPELLNKSSLDSYVTKQGSLTVRCDVVVFKEFLAEEPVSPATFVSVPPSDLHRHLADLLETEKGADVVFKVRREKFAAHRCVLAARSPVFSAELFGAMKESHAAADVVQVKDMEPPVFKALLCFLYTDSLPEMRKDDEDVMCQHLLVAADRYDLERLKLVCESKLCEYIDVGTAATILTLAEQHHCNGLKKACFNFLGDPAKLRAVMASDGFKHLSRSCPSIKKDLLSMLEP